MRDLLCIGVASALLAACSEPVAPIAPSEAERMLPFLQDGATARSEIVTRLGEPRSRYEAGRILTYALAETREGDIRVVSQEVFSMTGQYDLVLVFDADGVLQRHSVVARN